MSAPGNPRDYSKLPFAVGNAAIFGGSPGEGMIFNNRLVYPLGDYTPGVTLPQLRVFDGITDRGVASIPKNVDGV
ncbi:MAG: hypothetical protein JWL83_4096, partial [Actinomycetia bacterium]|nr:hypothetical protein [Actinomycetes bacterium]